MARVGTDASSSTSSDTGSMSVSHTLGVGSSNRIVFVCYNIGDGDPQGTITATYGGETMTQAVADDNMEGYWGWDYSTGIFYLLEDDLPSDGSNSAVVSYTGALTGGHIYVLCWDGLEQQAPTDTDVVNDTADWTSLSNTLTAVADDYILSALGSEMFGCDPTTVTHNESQSELCDLSIVDVHHLSVAELVATGSVLSLSSDDDAVGADPHSGQRVCAVWEPAAGALSASATEASVTVESQAATTGLGTPLSVTAGAAFVAAESQAATTGLGTPLSVTAGAAFVAVESQAAGTTAGTAGATGTAAFVTVESRAAGTSLGSASAGAAEASVTVESQAATTALGSASAAAVAAFVTAESQAAGTTILVPVGADAGAAFATVESQAASTTLGSSIVVVSGVAYVVTESQPATTTLASEIAYPELVPSNFRYWMEQITPAYKGAVVPRFRSFEPGPEGDEIGESTGCSRMFYVQPISTAADRRATSQASREADFIWRVHVYYPFVLTHNEMLKLVIQDRHDIRKQLRDTRHNVGHEGSATTDVGILGRWCTGDEFADRDKTIWRYSSEWRVPTRETE